MHTILLIQKGIHNTKNQIIVVNETLYHKFERNQSDE